MASWLRRPDADADVDDDALEALAEAHAHAPPEGLRERTLAAVRVRQLERSALRARQLALVAAAAAVTLAGSLLWEARRPPEADPARVALEAERARLRAELAEQRHDLGLLEDLLGVHSEVVRILTSPDFRHASLVAPGGGEGSARVLMDPNSGAVAVLGRGLPPPQPGRVYELWAIRDDGTPEATGSLGGTERAFAVRVRYVPTPGEVREFAISLEAQPGGERPTGPIVLAGKVE